MFSDPQHWTKYEPFFYVLLFSYNKYNTLLQCYVIVTKEKCRPLGTNFGVWNYVLLTLFSESLVFTQ